MLFRSDLPRAWSGHNTYWLWWPRHASIDVVVAMGFSAGELRQWFADVRPVALLGRGYVADHEAEGQPVVICREPRITGDELRDRIKLFT